MDNNITDTHDHVCFQKLHQDAIIPVRSTEHSAGFDLFALQDTLIIGGAGNILVPTGIAVNMPDGCYGRIAMRSGLAMKQHLTVSAGVIDVDYTGSVGVLVSSTKIFDLRRAKLYKGEIKSRNFYQITTDSDQDASTGPVITKDAIIAADIPIGEKVFLHESIGCDLCLVVDPHVYLIKKGERFAQLIIEKCDYSPGVEVSNIESMRGVHAGFGSTGK